MVFTLETQKRLINHLAKENGAPTALELNGLKYNTALMLQNIIVYLKVNE